MWYNIFIAPSVQIISTCLFQHFIYDYKLVRKNVDLNEALECNPNANNPEVRSNCMYTQYNKCPPTQLTGRPAQQTVHHRHFSRSATFVAQHLVNHLPLPGNRVCLYNYVVISNAKSINLNVVTLGKQ